MWKHVIETSCTEVLVPQTASGQSASASKESRGRPDVAEVIYRLSLIHMAFHSLMTACSSAPDKRTLHRLAACATGTSCRLRR